MLNIKLDIVSNVYTVRCTQRSVLQSEQHRYLTDTCRTSEPPWRKPLASVLSCMSLPVQPVTPVSYCHSCSRSCSNQTKRSLMCSMNTALCVSSCSSSSASHLCTVSVSAIRCALVAALSSTDVFHEHCSCVSLPFTFVISLPSHFRQEGCPLGSSYVYRFGCFVLWTYGDLKARRVVYPTAATAKRHL